MANILLLVHRLPYPPNKGDKVRSYHLLKHLAMQHQIFLGTFVDDPFDMEHVDTVRSFCRELHVAQLDPKVAKIRSLTALATSDPLSLNYYRDDALQDWVDQLCSQQKIDAVVVFSSPMAQYIESMPQLPVIIDFVDVDSAKWTQYAPNHHWPMSWLYRREGRTLLNYERKIAALSVRSFFVTDAEVALFTQLAPECADRVDAICNGVDADYFSPDTGRQTPYSPNEIPVVFTGAMDYLPNVDAACWFSAEVMPKLRERWPQVHFYIVGRSPTTEVLALANASVTITGTVSDVRPYIQHAAVVVAPLRIARGIQNKILEAMAMSRAVVASTECAAAVDAITEQELLTATTPTDFINEIDSLLKDAERSARIGRAARQRVLSRYSWDAHLGGMDKYLLPLQAATI